MNKRTTSLLAAMVLAVTGSLPAAAQFDAASNGFDPNSKLITSAVQLSSPASDSSEGTHIEYLIDDNIGTFWHSDWHGTYTGKHYIQVELPEDITGYYQMVFGRRNNSNTCQATTMLVEESTDGVTWNEVKSLSLPWNGDGDLGTYVVSDIFRLKNAHQLRFTCTKTNNNSTTWHCAELQVYPANEEAALASAIDELLVRYDRYLPGFPEELSIGSGFGQYADTEAWANFQTHMDIAMQLSEAIDDGKPVDKDQVNAIVDQVEEDYRALMASLVTFSMPSGYYRIVGAMKYYTDVESGETDIDGNPVMDRNFYDIAMYGSLDGWCWWGARDTQDARQLWQLSMVGKDVHMVNAATDMQCSGLRDGAIGMSAEVDTLMGFDYVGTQDGHDIFYIRYASSPTDYEASGSTYFHQWGHDKGAGEAPHKLCMWQATWNKGEEYTGDKGTSEWYLEPVSDQEAQELLAAYDLVKNHDKLVLAYQDIIKEAKAGLETARDLRATWAPDTQQPVIKATSQFHSLWTEGNEGSLNNLLDGDPNTYWHSAYSAGKATGPHQASLDVTVEEPLIGNYEVYVLRRNTKNDHITRVSLYGSNDEAALSETADTQWTLICDNVSMPWTNGQKDVYSQPFTITKPYKYLRFYEEDGNGQDNYGYTNCGHYATFQIYPASQVRPSQLDMLGEVATRLDSIVKGYDSLDLEALTLEQYNDLAEAYKAFAARLVDPSPLRNAIAANTKYVDYVVTGTAPGYWTSTETADALDAVLKEAKAYDDAAALTQEQSDRYVASIEAAQKAIFASAIGVDTTKWYHLQFDSEENFDAHGWSKTAIANGTLYGQRIAAGTRTDGVGTVLESEQIVAGSELYYFSPDVVGNVEASQFRFVPLNDSTYALQNRASGLYVHRNVLNSNGGISLQWLPAAFTAKPIGYGQNVLYMTAIDGTQVTYPHLNAWESTCSFVGTWDDSNPGCNSGLLIMPVEDIDPEGYAPERVLSRLRGDIAPLCLPTSVATESGVVYLPLGCLEKDGASYLALKNVDGDIEAGTPFFVIPEGTYDGESTEDVYLHMRSHMTSEPKQLAGLVGTFTDKWIGTGYVGFSAGEAKAIEGTDTGHNFSVPAGSAYLKYGEARVSDDADYDLAIQISGKYTDWTSIEHTVASVAKRGNVYGMDGQLLRQNATLQDVKALGRGLYIINGVKVLVK